MRRVISSDPVQTEFLQIRMHNAQKRELAQAAKQHGLTLSEFTRRALSAATSAHAA